MTAEMGQGSFTRVLLPSNRYLAVSGDIFLIVKTGGVRPEVSGRGEGAANTLQAVGSPPRQRIIWPDVSLVPGQRSLD